MRNKVIVAAGVLVILVLAAVAVDTFKEASNLLEYNNSIGTATPSNFDPEETIASVTSIDEQPAGFGEKTVLSDEEVNAIKNNGAGSIDFGDVSIPKSKVKNYSNEMADIVANAAHKEDDGRYTCNISWSKGLAQNDYDALSIIVGQMYEDNLNKNERGRYEVTVSRPTGPIMEEVEVPTYWDIDEDYNLTIWIVVEEVDLKENTKVKNLKPFTLYYELNYLNLK